MSVSVNVLHCFGLKGDVQDNIWWFDDNIIVYPAGDNIVIYDTLRKTQKFLNGGLSSGAETIAEPLEGITALAISPNKRFVAVAEKGSMQAFVSIYEVFTQKRKKVLSTRDCMSKSFSAIAFSPDSKFLVTQGGEPDWSCFLWSWEKNPKPMAFFKPSPAALISQVSFHPNDNSVFCISGNGVLKLYRYIDNNLKLLPGSSTSALALAKREQTLHCLCHAWVAEERIVVGTESGELLLFESTGEFKTVLPQSPSDGQPITAIAAYSKGFICGGGGGFVMTYEKTDDKDYYRKTRVIPIAPNLNNVTVNAANIQIPIGTIKSLVVSPSEENLMCSTDKNQILLIKIPPPIDAEATNNAAREGELSAPVPSQPSFQYLTSSFHSHPVTGLDVCTRKPWVVTSSTDKTVRLWNHKTNSLEVIKSFPEDVYCVAIHPSGFHVLVGFSDKLRLLNILMKDLVKVTEFDIRSCRECRFSNGGQFFAAVNGTIVHIFNTYTFENIGNLRGHNGKVKSVYWSPDDSKIITCGLDGAVYDWQVKDFKRMSENVHKTCLYTCAVCTEDGKTIYAAGSDKKLKEIIDNEVSNSFIYSVSITQLALSHSGKLLFAGTEKGTIRCYKFPITGDYTEYFCHSGPVTRLRVSNDDSILFSTGEDASVFILEIKSKDIKPKKVSESQLYADIDQILVSRADIEEKNQQLEKMKAKYDELSMHHEYQIKLKELNATEKIKELKENFSHQLDQWKIKYESLMQDKADTETEYSNKLKDLVDKHKKKLQDIENKHQHQIVEDQDRYQQLLKAKEDLQAQFQHKLNELQAKHDKQMQELKEMYEVKYKENQLRLESERKEVEELNRTFDETRTQIEEDADREIEQLKHEYEEKLAIERQNVLKLRGENNMMSKRFNSQTKEINELKEEIASLNEQRRMLQNQIHAHEKESMAQKKEIRDRDDTLSEKEKRIFDLKKRNQELEKFKFVLDYTIKELKKQIEPLNTEIADLKDQIKDMDQELERYHKNSSGLEMTIRDLRLKLDAFAKEIDLQKKRAIKAESECRRMRTDLHDAMQLIQEPNQLKERIKELYKKHVDVHVTEVALDTDIQKEYNRQREYLERSVASLKKQLSKESEKHRTDNNKIMQENVALITEINALRRELKLLKQSQKDKELVFITRRDVTSSPSDLPTRRATAHGHPQSASHMSSRAPTARNDNREEARMIEMQREEIKRLRKRIVELEASALANSMKRPISREKLSPATLTAEPTNDGLPALSH